MAATKFVSYGVWLMLLCLANLDTSSCDVNSEKILGYFEVLREEFKELKDFVRNNTETTKHQLETRLVNLTETISRNEKLLNVIKNSTSDLLSFIPCNMQKPNILCISNSHGANWIVVQQRIGLYTTSFNRTWSEYREGFGPIAESSNFWWGLERLYQLTKDKNYELLVEVTNEAGEMRFARYSQFKIGNEAEKYKLLELSGFSGNEQDIITYRSDYVPTGQMFSTIDSDNDQWKEGNCASSFGGGWWWNVCKYSINRSGSYAKHASWSNWSFGSMKSTRMSVRERK